MWVPKRQPGAESAGDAVGAVVAKANEASDHGGSSSSSGDEAACAAVEPTLRTMPRAGIRHISPLDIRFSQTKMRHLFGDGRRVAAAVPLVRAVRCASEETAQHGATWKLQHPFPQIEVLRWRAKLRDESGRPKVDTSGEELLESRAHWFSLDNRRLYCLQEAALRVWPDRCVVEVAEVKPGPQAQVRELRKFRTLCGGRSINIGSSSDGVPFVRWSWRQKIGVQEESDSSGPEAESRYTKAAAKTAWKPDVLDHLDAMKQDDIERIEISKKISYILRRGAKAANLEMDDEGWMRVKDLLKVEHLGNIDQDKCVAIIEASNKQKLRYELRMHGGNLEVRATSKRGTDHASRRRETRTVKELWHRNGAQSSTTMPTVKEAGSEDMVSSSTLPVGAGRIAVRTTAVGVAGGGRVIGAAPLLVAASTSYAPAVTPSGRAGRGVGAIGSGGGKASAGRGNILPQPHPPGPLQTRPVVAPTPPAPEASDGHVAASGSGRASSPSSPSSKALPTDQVMPTARTAKQPQPVRTSATSQPTRPQGSKEMQAWVAHQMQAARHMQYMQQMQAMYYGYQTQMQQHLQALGQVRYIRQVEAMRRMREHAIAMQRIRELMQEYDEGRTEGTGDLEVRIKEVVNAARMRAEASQTSTLPEEADQEEEEEEEDQSLEDAAKETMELGPQDLQAKIAEVFEAALARSSTSAVASAPATTPSTPSAPQRSGKSGGEAVAPAASAAASTALDVEAKIAEAIEAARARSGEAAVKAFSKPSSAACQAPIAAASAAAEVAATKPAASAAGPEDIQAKIAEALAAAKARRGP